MVYSRFSGKVWIFLLAEFFIILLFSLWSPLGTVVATPRFWRDEAIPFEIARTYVELGKLDVAVAPGVVDGDSYKTHATGFIVTVPLALWMRVFGVGLLQARIFMMLWIVAAIGVLFFVVKKFFGIHAAMAGTLLVSTFSSFYADGRTVTGEIPGFVFLLLGLYSIYARNNFLAGGFLLMLAVVAKPSTYLMILPALALEFLFFERAGRIKKIGHVVLGTLPIIFLWIWIILPGPLSPKSWQTLFNFYAHPFNESSLFSRLMTEWTWVATQPTLIYFGVIACAIMVALYRGAYDTSVRRLVHFIFLFGVFCVVYFLRSPGWLRYLLPVELLLLASLFPALEKLLSWRVATTVVVGLSLLQSVVFFFFADIPSGTKSVDTARFINETLLRDKRDTVGLIDLPTVAALISSHKKFQVGSIGGRDFYGMHPLSYDVAQLPTFVLSYNNNFQPYESVLSAHYQKTNFVTPAGQEVYKRL